MINCTYNSFNDKLFYLMNKEELVVAARAIKDTIDLYSSIGVNLINNENWQAYQNCIFNLNKF